MSYIVDEYDGLRRIHGHSFVVPNSWFLKIPEIVSRLGWKESAYLYHRPHWFEKQSEKLVCSKNMQEEYPWIKEYM